MIFNSIEQFRRTEGGVLLVDKPAGMTSFDVIRFLRRVTGIRKIGHAGTLDPSATGLLILASGPMTRGIGAYQAMRKAYEGLLRLGGITASHDADTPVLVSHSTEGITEAGLRAAAKEFVGVVSQVPPMYSAVKIGGRRLYSLARQGKEIEREARQVNIQSFELTDIQIPDVAFGVECSSGTYIRTLAHDLGARLGCGAHLCNLRRTAIGDYAVSDAWSPADIENSVLQCSGVGV